MDEDIKIELSELTESLNWNNFSDPKNKPHCVERGTGNGRVNQYYRDGYIEELEKEMKTLKQKMGGQTKAIQSKNSKIEELKEMLKKKTTDLKALKSKSHEKNIIKTHLEKHCTPAQTRKLMNPDFNHQRKYEESDFILAAALKSMSPEAYRLIRRKSILSIPGKTVLNQWLREHKEYAGLFVGCRKEEENGGESEDENENNFNLISSNPQLKHFMTHIPDKIDINVKSEVGGSIIQLKKRSFHQSIDYFDTGLGKLKDKSDFTAIELAIALLREAMLALGTRDSFYPKLELGTMILHLCTRSDNSSGLLKYFKVIEREAGKENIKWNDRELLLRLQEKILEKVNSGSFSYDPSILPDFMKKDDEMIVTDMEGNPVLLTYVDISTGHTTLEPGLEQSAVEGMVSLSAEKLHSDAFKSPKKRTDKNLDTRSEDVRIKKRLKRDEISKEFGEAVINFNAKLDCRLCDKKLESYSLLDQHLFSEHQQGALCQLCKIENESYECYHEHSKLHAYTCQHCNKQFRSVPDLNKHLDLLHLPTQCPVCLKICAHKHGLSSHMTQSHRNKNTEELKCTRCQFKSVSKIQMMNHFESSHKHKDVQREQQPINLTNQRPVKSYLCPICSKSYVNQIVLEKHIQTHGVNQFRCSLCQFKTLDASNLREHMRIHISHKAVRNKENPNPKSPSTSRTTINASQVLPEFRITQTEVMREADQDIADEYTVTTIEVEANDDVTEK